MAYKECLCQPSKALIVLLSLAPLCPTKIPENARILLANLHQSSRSTFSWESFPSFFAFQEGMLDTQILALGGWPTVSARYVDTRLEALRCPQKVQ